LLHGDEKVSGVSSETLGPERQVSLKWFSRRCQCM